MSQLLHLFKCRALLLNIHRPVIMMMIKSAKVQLRRVRGLLCRVILQQKLKVMQHFEKNRMTQKERGDWMNKTFMLKKKLSRSAVAY